MMERKRKERLGVRVKSRLRAWRWCRSRGLRKRKKRLGVRVLGEGVPRIDSWKRSWGRERRERSSLCC